MAVGRDNGISLSTVIFIVDSLPYRVYTLDKYKGGHNKMTKPTKKILITHNECQRCGHVWVPRKANDVRICPKCKSAYWDTPKAK